MRTCPPLALALALFLGTPSAARADLFVSSQFNSAVLRYDGVTGAPVGSGVFVPSGSAGLDNPIGLSFGPDGDLYVASHGNSEILRYDGVTGAPVGSSVFVASGSGGLNSPYFFAFSPQAPLPPAAAVPERATGLLLATALASLAAARDWPQRQRRKASGRESR